MEYNKQYKRKGSVSNNIFIPVKKELINNTEYVIFNNGARCTIETFKQDFELYNMNENNNNMNENNIFYDNDEQPLNPDDFFAPKVDETLINTVESIVNNPNQYVGRQRPESRDLNNPHSQHNLHSQHNQQIPTHMMSNDRPVMNYDLDSVLNHNLDSALNHNTQQHNVQTNRLPEHDIFDRVKANSDLEITIPFMLVIPKSQKIDTMDDMFESSFVDYLAEKYINTIVVENLDLLKNLIRDGIQEWVEISLTSKKRKAVVKSKPFDIKKSKEVKTKTKVKAISTDEDITNILRGVNNNKAPINFDINKMYLIKNKNEYDFVKSKYDEVLKTNPKHPELDRYMDMIDMYMRSEPTVEDKEVDTKEVDTKEVDTKEVDTEVVDTEVVDTEVVDTEVVDTEVVDTVEDKEVDEEE